MKRRRPAFHFSPPAVLWEGTVECQGQFRIVETDRGLEIEQQGRDATGGDCWFPAQRFRHEGVLLVAVRDLAAPAGGRR